MPYEDEPYSGREESDADSFSEELSPTDGYFHRREVPADVMVSLDSSKSAAGGIISPPQTYASVAATFPVAASPPRPPIHLGGSSSPLHSSTSALLPDTARAPSASYIPHSAISSRAPDDMFSKDPLHSSSPPAYSAAPSPSPQTQHYSTVSPHHLEQGIPPRLEQDNMRRSGDQPNEFSPLSGKPLPTTFSCRAFLQKYLFAALVLSVTITLLTMIFKLHQSGEFKFPSRDWPAPEHGDTTSPYCPSATIKSDSLIYELPKGRELTVIQKTYDNARSNVKDFVQAAGEIRLRRLPKDSKLGARGYFSVDIHVSDKNIAVLREWDESSRSLTIKTPKYGSHGSFVRPCVSLEITAWLPEDAELENLVMEAISLSLRVFDDVKVDVSERSKFSTVSGNVIFPPIDGPHGMEQAEASNPTSISISKAAFQLSSRRIVVETVSGFIHGVFPLFDYLGLSSVSGNIKADVSPQRAKSTAATELEVQTKSGSIEINLPVADAETKPPSRDYSTRVSSVSGRISGSFFLGSEASFTTVSGGIVVTILPVFPSGTSNNGYEGPNSDFRTQTTSGGTQVQIMDPVYVSLPLSTQKLGEADPAVLPSSQDVSSLSKISAQPKWHSLRSTHQSTSGRICVHYPEAWEGTISGTTVSGKIAVEGSGIKIVRETKGIGHREVRALRRVDREGDGSVVQMKNLSGDVEFVVGAN